MLCAMRRFNITSIQILILVYCMLNLISKTESLNINGIDIGFNKTCSSNQNVTCYVYYIKDVGCSAKAATAFPQLYRISEDSRFPEKPESMKTEVINKIHSNNKYYTGLKITLRAPATGSFDVLKGFELIFTYNLDNKYGCLIFDLSAQKLTYNDVIKTDFHVDVWPMSPADPPVIYLVSRSLPPAPAKYDRYLNATEYIKQGDFGVCVPTQGCNGVVSSSQWKGTIFYKPLTNSSGPFNEVEMSFARAPPEFGFSLYTVSLFKATSLSEPVSQLNLTNQNPRHVFRKLKPGTYVIKVIPFDENFNLGPYHCLCKTQTNVCQSCITTITENFTLGYKSGSTTVTHPLPHSNEDAIVPTVLGCVLGLLLAIVLAFLFVYWRKKNTEGDADTEEKLTNFKSTNIDIGKDNSIFSIEDHEPIRAKDRVLPMKTVFLAYAEDHECHKEVLNAFASFLKRHCRCDVIFAPWRMTDIMQDKFRWVINSMDQADYTVIINSITAYEQYKQWKSNGKKNSKIFQGSPLADLFIPILNQTCIRLNNLSDYRKFIMVRFDYTQKEHTINDLNSGGEYVLMKHLQEFLCHIHQLEQHKTKMEDVGLAFVDDFTQLLEGSRLNEKIQKAREYEAKFPRRMNSETSTDSGLDSAESLPESDRQTIKKMYEENLPSNCPGNVDSITDVIHYQMLGIEECPASPHYSHLEDSSDPNTFHPPSIITDDTSEVLWDKMFSLNLRNRGFESLPTSFDYHEDNNFSDEESCRSIGGKSV
ncbi:uncharacterized protein LOC125653614 isoform X2 [Ostrea edulis]|uniref:uncharacterized protein LOC125653614 isoform X2 n=1 Tax=Ostrea edulis TaxID=37623 RepID=UPI0024AE99D3|nr:uncharacterized protein LOC125653614 isoform X2 [Ostrea edulis]